MRLRMMGVMTVAAAMLALAATPALAISTITNDFSASDQSISTGQKVSFKARTTYSWQYMPNPYTSNFLTEVNYRHFNKPVTTSASGVSSAWTYKNTGRYIAPAWQIWKGSFVVGTTQSRYVNFSATAKRGSKGNRQRHYHGQWDNGWDSAGIPAYLYTTHN